MKRFFSLLIAIMAGATTVDAQESHPLIIMDGIVISYEMLGSNTFDIESITVLKDSESVLPYASLGDVSGGVILIDLKDSDVEDLAFISVDIMPKFMGSSDLMSFATWLNQNVRYPLEALDQGISGRVIVNFVVGADGYIAPQRTTLLEGNEMLYAEVLRVLALSPRWEPGIQKGEAVPVCFTVPIVFKIHNSAATTINTDLK